MIIASAYVREIGYVGRGLSITGQGHIDQPFVVLRRATMVDYIADHPGEEVPTVDKRGQSIRYFYEISTD